jgi:hypothetical protein
MSGILLPVLLATAGLIAAIMTYSGIRRGGARFYTLEREAILRRASFTLFVSVLLFLSAIGLFIFQQQPGAVEPDAELLLQGVESEDAIPPTAVLEQFPPTITPTPVGELPTATPTPIVCRAIVEGTSGNGLKLRTEPNGDEISILPDGSVLTVLPDEPVELGGFTWRKVRIVGGEEGWVAQNFLTIRAPCE